MSKTSAIETTNGQISPEDIFPSYNKAVTNGINAAFPELHAKFIPATNSSGFHFDIKEIAYNPNTLLELDYLVSNDGNGNYSLGKSFSDYYQKIIKSAVHKFSAEDQAALDDADNKVADILGKLSAEYVKTNDFNDTATYPKPQAASGIFRNILKFTQAKTLAEINLDEFPELGVLVGYYRDYASQNKAAAAIMDGEADAECRQKAIADHVVNPGNAADALSVIGSNTPNIAYTGLPETAGLRQTLNGTDKSVTISFSMDSITETSSHFTFDNKVEGDIPVFGVLNFFVEHDSHLDYTKFAESGASMSITLTYNGVTKIPNNPANISSDLSKGWYDSVMLGEIAKNIGGDITGMALANDEYKDAFGADGKLRRLETLIISAQPTMSITFDKFDYQSVKSVFTQDTSVDVTLFGFIPIGGHTNHYTATSFSEQSSDSSFTVTFSPPPYDKGAVSTDQTAVLLGGVIDMSY